MTGSRSALDLRRLLAYLLVLGLTLYAHAGGLQNDFVLWDDNTHVTQNPVIRSLAPENLAVMFTTFIAKLYIPLTWVSLAIDYQLWGEAASGYHLTNLLLHLANTLLVLALVERVLVARANGLERRALPVALVAALLFGVHPLRVESVAWVTERKDVLFGFFYLLALWAYLRFIRESHAKWYGVALGMFLLAALSKSAAVTFPAVIFLLEGWLTQRWRWRPVIPFVVVSLLIGLATLAAQGSGEGETIAGLQQIPFGARFGLVGYCALFYVGKLLSPLKLSALYPTFDEMAWSGWHTSGWLLSFVAVTVLLWILRRRWALLWPAWLFYLVTLSPTIGILPVGIHVVADRYCYLPFLGLALLGGGIVTGLWGFLRQRSRLAAGVAATIGFLLVTGLSHASRVRTRVWQDTETLFADVLQHDPDNWLAHLKLAATYRRMGYLEGALNHARRAVALEPQAPLSRTCLAYVLIDLQAPRGALAQLRPLADAGTANPDVWQALGEAFMAMQDWSNARAALQQARGLPGANTAAIDQLLSRVARRETRTAR